MLASKVSIFFWPKYIQKSMKTKKCNFSLMFLSGFRYRQPNKKDRDLIFWCWSLSTFFTNFSIFHSKLSSYYFFQSSTKGLFSTESSLGASKSKNARANASRAYFQLKVFFNNQRLSGQMRLNAVKAAVRN